MRARDSLLLIEWDVFLHDVDVEQSMVNNSRINKGILLWSPP